MKNSYICLILVWVLLSSCQDSDIALTENTPSYSDSVAGIWYSDAARMGIELRPDSTFDFLQVNYATGYLEKNHEHNHSIAFSADSFFVSFACDLLVLEVYGMLVAHEGSYLLLDDGLLLDLEFFFSGDTLRRARYDEQIVSPFRSGYGCKVSGKVLEESIDGTFTRSNYTRDFYLDYDTAWSKLYLNLNFSGELPTDECFARENANMFYWSIGMEVTNFQGLGTYDLTSDAAYRYAIGDILFDIPAKQGQLVVSYYDEEERRMKGAYFFEGVGDNGWGPEQIKVEDGWFDIYW